MKRIKFKIEVSAAIGFADFQRQPIKKSDLARLCYPNIKQSSANWKLWKIEKIGVEDVPDDVVQIIADNTGLLYNDLINELNK